MTVLERAMAIADGVGPAFWKRATAYPLLAIALAKIFRLEWNTGLLVGLAGVSAVSLVGWLLTTAP